MNKQTLNNLIRLAKAMDEGLVKASKKSQMYGVRMSGLIREKETNQ